MIAFLKKPYPYLGELKKDLTGNVLVGLFIALFLIVFQPFGINGWETENKILKLAGFGAISALVPTIVSAGSYLLLPSSFKEEKWTVGMEIAVILVVLFFIALFNLLYGRLLGVAVISLQNFISALTVTCLIGVFPVSFHVFRKHNRLLKRNLAESLQLTQSLKQSAGGQKSAGQNVFSSSSVVVLTAENEKDKMEISLEQLHYIESADNYSCIVSFDGKQRKKEMIRSSLKRLESQISQTQLIRCHRTFIVNVEKVNKVEGNAAGYKLYLHSGDVVPVSRNYIQVIKERIVVPKDL
jgi:hypothetical protein